MADTKLVLGDFEFQEFEIPAVISLGGDQVLVTHKLPGGARFVQSMGRDDAPISWTGSIYSADALDRMRQLDLMRAQGQTQSLTLFGLNYQVVVKSFVPRIERSYRVQYSIELVVISDNTQAQQLAPEASIDASIRSDASAASALGGQIGDSSLTSSLAQLNSAVAGVANFQQASQSLLNVVRNPAASASLRVTQLVNGANTLLGSSASLAGVVAGVPASTSASAFMAQAGAAGQMPALYSLQATLGRISGNLSLLNPASGGRTLTTAGGNLFAAAGQVYGDATQWAALAQANSVSDPILTSVQTLDVPQSPPDNGGLFSA